MNRLQEKYNNEIVPAMIEKFGYKNIMQVPKLNKIVINMGVGEAKDNSKVLDSAVKDLEIIAGQKAVVTKAKKSIANFKIREGLPIGCNSFDGRGNYALGIKEQLIFPEIEYDKVDKVRGMDVIFVTTANTDEEARELIRLFGMPYVK